MMHTEKGRVTTETPPIYIVSGGTGASAEQLVHTVLVQFPDIQVPVITIAPVRQIPQVETVVAQAAASGGTIVHTLVDDHLREMLIQLAYDKGVPTIDLMGDLLSHLSVMLGLEPIGKPGLYRQLHQEYFERVSAIEFTMAHDDGMDPENWHLAEIILIGVSRVGKTPLSVYLSVLGWKVANTPIVLGVPVPQMLFQLDPRRVIGLDIDANRLLVHRQRRLNRIGVKGPSDYINMAKVKEELDLAQKVFQQGDFSVIDVTDRPIETSANEIIELITGKFESESRKR